MHTKDQRVAKARQTHEASAGDSSRSDQVFKASPTNTLKVTANARNEQITMAQEAGMVSQFILHS